MRGVRRVRRGRVAVSFMLYTGSDGLCLMRAVERGLEEETVYWTRIRGRFWLGTITFMEF